ncbi:MAG: hypothetical protein IPI76_00170 [Chloracidobacterium sp.]|nr:hypothetical protein [Chloracidobacterium sp.]
MQHKSDCLEISDQIDERRGELKFKETLINVLKFFHLKKHKKLISHDNWERNIPNYERLMSANVVIPKELFPKEETFFYGELLTTKPKKIYPSELLKVTKDISILEFLTKDESLGSEVKADCLQKLKSLEDEEQNSCRK